MRPVRGAGHGRPPGVVLGHTRVLDRGPRAADRDARVGTTRRSGARPRARPRRPDNAEARRAGPSTTTASRGAPHRATAGRSPPDHAGARVARLVLWPARRL